MDNNTIKYTDKIINYDSYFEKNKEKLFSIYKYFYSKLKNIINNISKKDIDKLLEYQSDELVIKMFSMQGKLIQAKSESDELNKEIESLREYNSLLFSMLEKYRNSTSFFIGALILKPISFFRTLFINKSV